ncbi:nicotinamide mononucleotide transporter [Methanobacterium sp. CWC-01]|uniref:nicotinamide mononucleotide transporter n=1 Tax=Methanobacterium aridiramus TaxID=2584467 RepID=UPI0025778FCA|nr:nicotinamide mononucleotide transporter [Methanobacterium sp. CWC-01]
MNILQDIQQNKLFWLASLLGLLGTILNAYQSVYGFMFWMISNPILMYQAYTKGSWNIGIMFFLYFGLAVMGFIQWSG